MLAVIFVEETFEGDLYFCHLKQNILMTTY